MKRDLQVLLNEAISLATSIRHAEKRIADMNTLIANSSEDSATRRPARWLLSLSLKTLEKRRSQWNRWRKRYGEFLAPHNQETIETIAMKEDAFMFAYQSLKYRKELEGMDATSDEAERAAAITCLEMAKRDWERVKIILSSEEVEEILTEAEKTIIEESL